MNRRGASRRIAFCSCFLVLTAACGTAMRPPGPERAAVATPRPGPSTDGAASIVTTSTVPTAPPAGSASTTPIGSTSAPPPIAEHATELARVLAIAKSHGTAEGHGWSLKQPACIEILGPRCKKVTQFEHAFVSLHAKGRALTVVVVSSCDGDSCVVHAWLYTDVRPPRAISEPPFVVAPDLSWVIFDRITMPAGATWDARLARLDLVTGATTTFADCVSPSLSPGEKWIACRTNDGSVYRVPVAGGNPTMVMQGTSAIIWIPYAHLFPPPVSFPSPTTFEVEDGVSATKVLPWSE